MRDLPGPELSFSNQDWRSLKHDYGLGDLDFVSRILNENSVRLSRTRKGISDTSSSSAKRQLLLQGDDLRRRSAQNEQRAQQLIFQRRNDPPPTCASAVKSFLFAVADTINEGLLPEGRLRTWPIECKPLMGPQGEMLIAPAKISPDQVESCTDGLCGNLFDRWGEISSDPIPLIAAVEWQLNGGELHPFYDGCGRISRTFAAGLLLKASVLLPSYEHSTHYFVSGVRGAFPQYLLDSIAVTKQSLKQF